MFTLSHLKSTPPESIKSQVLQMVVDYLSDISPVCLSASNPLYPLYQYVIGYEVHLHLQSMTGTTDSPVQLLVALDDQDPLQVLGFALLQTSTEADSFCQLSYLAVAEPYRQQGIAHALVQRAISLYPHTELACSPAQAGFFAGFGLQVLAVRGPQLLLGTQDHLANLLISAQDLAAIFQSTEAVQIQRYLLKQHGKAAMLEAERLHKQQVQQQCEQANRYLHNSRH